MEGRAKENLPDQEHPVLQSELESLQNDGLINLTALTKWLAVKNQ